MTDPIPVDPATAHRRGRWPEGRPPGIVASVAPWYALLGGGAAWALHLVFAYLLVEIACHSERLAGTILGMGTGHAAGLALTLVAALIAIGAIGVAWAMAGDGVPIDPVDDPGAPEVLGRRRFIAYVGVVMNGLFLLAIVLAGLAFLFLNMCSAGWGRAAA